MAALRPRNLRLPAIWKSPWQRYALVVAAFAFSFLVRYALFGHLYGDHGYVVFIPAIILTTLFAGVRPGILTMVLSGAANWYVFIPPSWNIKAAVALATFATSATITIFLARW
jgi:K+-sensing histidine kinase KdpD